MESRTRLISGIFLFVASTLCYHVPSYVYSLAGYDFSKVPEDFYSFYCLFIALQLFLIAIYAFYLLVHTETKYYKTKMLFCWMFIAETSTFLDHVFRKYIISASHSNIDMAITAVVFTICFSWVLNAILHEDMSDPFNSEKTYAIKYKPKNIFGIFNYIKNHAGHGAIYQDGRIYKFRRNSNKKSWNIFHRQPGKIEAIRRTPKQIRELIKENRIVVKEGNRVEDIGELIGIKYQFFKYNCNHLANETKTKKT